MSIELKKSGSEFVTIIGKVFGIDICDYIGTQGAEDDIYELSKEVPNYYSHKVLLTKMVSVATFPDDLMSSFESCGNYLDERDVLVFSIYKNTNNECIMIVFDNNVNIQLSNAINMFYKYFLQDKINKDEKFANELDECLKKERITDYKYLDLVRKKGNICVDLASYKRLFYQSIRKRDMIDGEIYNYKTLDLFKNMDEHVKQIEANEYVENAKFESGKFIINTIPLYMYTEDMDRYYLGKMEITFNIYNGSVKLINRDNPRFNYWGSDGHHPHVDEFGEPCLGNCDTMIADYSSQGEYYAVFLTLLGYCQSVDITDPAGELVRRWDKVDEYGNIIEEGECNVVKCKDCGEIIYLNEDDYYTCDVCGAILCDDCVIQADDGHTILCDACAEEAGAYCCCNCNNIYTRDNLIYDEVSKDYYCEDCYKELIQEREAEEAIMPLVHELQQEEDIRDDSLDMVDPF